MKIVLGKGQILGPISGADESLVTYATELQKAGHTISVLFIYQPSADDQHYRRLVEADVPVSCASSNSARTLLGTGRKVASRLLRAFPSSQRAVRENARRVATGMAARYYGRCRDVIERAGADMLHVITPDPGAMVLIRAGHDAGVPVIYQELGTPYDPPGFQSYYEQFTEVLPLCSEVAALSPRLAEQCRRKLPHSPRLCVVPLMSNETCNGHNGHRARRATGGEVTFGFAARLESLKGPVTLMEAFGRVCGKSPNARLKVAGDGSLKAELSAMAEASNAARRYSHDGIYTRPEERSAFMRGMDIFVLPSLTEGTPHGIMEAMAHAKPVIASAVGGIPDMIGADSGLLVPPGDADALADAMLLLARDPRLRAELGAGALARYRRLFSPQAVLPVMLETYRRVASKNGNGSRAPAADNGHAHPWAGPPQPLN